MLGKLYSEFKAWMHYNPPCALSMSGWRSFDDEFKQYAPVRHWLTKRLPKIFYPVKYRIIRIKEWFRYRTINRYHVIDTGLAPGYHENDTLLLHGPFNILKDFVEKEEAWLANIQTLTYKEQLPLYYELFYRKPELGVSRLQWAATLDDPALPAHERCDHQAVAAREILALYTWWTSTRKLRTTDGPEYDFQGFEYGPLDEGFDRTAADYVQYDKWADEIDDLKEQWDKEDTEMLCRLMRVRQRLWT